MTWKSCILQPDDLCWDLHLACWFVCGCLWLWCWPQAQHFACRGNANKHPLDSNYCISCCCSGLQWKLRPCQEDILCFSNREKVITSVYLEIPSDGWLPQMVSGRRHPWNPVMAKAFYILGDSPVLSRALEWKWSKDVLIFNTAFQGISWAFGLGWYFPPCRSLATVWTSVSCECQRPLGPKCRVLNFLIRTTMTIFSL